MTAELVDTKLPLAYDQDGVIRVGGTRVTLDTVVATFEQGATAEEIAIQYPVLHLADIYQVIAYYLHNKENVNSYLQKREKQHEAVRKEVEARFDQTGIRERLLARMKHNMTGS